MIDVTDRDARTGRPYRGAPGRRRPLTALARRAAVAFITSAGLLAVTGPGAVADPVVPVPVAPVVEPVIGPVLDPTEPMLPTTPGTDRQREKRKQPSRRARTKRQVQRAQRERVVAFARKQVGKPYVWGAVGPRGYDCSGLMVAAYRTIGRTIPRTTFAQLRRLHKPRRLQAGDLVFGVPGHVAMYIGGGRVIHAPAPGRRIEVSDAGWHTRYARRTVLG